MNSTSQGVLSGLLSASLTDRLATLDRATQRRATLDWLLDRAEVVLGRLDLRLGGGRGRGRVCCIVVAICFNDGLFNTIYFLNF